MMQRYGRSDVCLYTLCNSCANKEEKVIAGVALGEMNVSAHDSVLGHCALWGGIVER